MVRCTFNIYRMNLSIVKMMGWTYLIFYKAAELQNICRKVFNTILTGAEHRNIYSYQNYH